jgi:hypothetical protein
MKRHVRQLLRRLTANVAVSKPKHGRADDVARGRAASTKSSQGGPLTERERAAALIAAGAVRPWNP